jgi:hypothetical protein
VATASQLACEEEAKPARAAHHQREGDDRGGC